MNSIQPNRATELRSTNGTVLELKRIMANSAGKTDEAQQLNTALKALGITLAGQAIRQAFGDEFLAGTRMRDEDPTQHLVAVFRKAGEPKPTNIGTFFKIDNPAYLKEVDGDSSCHLASYSLAIHARVFDSMSIAQAEQI